MKAGQNTKMRRGAIWACSIPVGLGIIGLLTLLLASVMGTLSQHELSVLGPIVAGFLFVPPLSILLACRSLVKIDSVVKLSRWRSSALRIVLAAALFHFLVVALHGVGTRASFVDQGFVEVLPYVVGAAVVHIIIWAITTLPLSLICASIFWKVTKFPEDTSVF